MPGDWWARPPDPPAPKKKATETQRRTLRSLYRTASARKAIQEVFTDALAMEVRVAGWEAFVEVATHDEAGRLINVGLAARRREAADTRERLQWDELS